MSTIRKWLFSASVALVLGSTSIAQLPGGTVVSDKTPLPAIGPSTGPILATTPPIPSGNSLPYPVASSPIPTPPPQGSWINQTVGDDVLARNCCDPVGGNGPLTSEIYIRTGPSLAFGDGYIARQMNTGWNTTLGGRALFFDVGAMAAWTLDMHVSYTYNNAGGQEAALFRNEIVKLRDVHRTGVGLGIGRDWFANGPGMVGGNWAGNLRYGFDAGCRYGTGHVNLTPLIELDPEGYRRHHDIFAQPFVGLHANVDIPIGGWNLLLGGRIEYNYTTVDFIHAPGDLHAIDLLLTFGVRY